MADDANKPQDEKATIENKSPATEIPKAEAPPPTDKISEKTAELAQDNEVVKVAMFWLFFGYILCSSLLCIRTFLLC